MTTLSKAVGLTLLLTIGFSVQQCNPLGCSCDKLRGKYFDIQGISADSFRKRGTCCADRMKAGEDVTLADHNLGVRYQINYFSAQLPHPRRAPFSLISSAAACDCIEDGYLGSRERLRSFTVVSINDFDAQHLANDTINDLLRTTVVPGQTSDFTAFLQADTAFIQHHDYVLYLKKRPELRTDFAARITIVLQNGESYTTSTPPVNIR